MTGEGGLELDMMHADSSNAWGALLSGRGLGHYEHECLRGLAR